MRELEAMIAEWRAGMTTALAGQEETVQELEEHLREEVERLERGGVGEREAFERAVARLGDRRSLAREFARSRSRWFGGAASRGATLMAYTAGALAFAGIFALIPGLVRLLRAVLLEARLRGDPLPPAFALLLVVSWMVACAVALRASRRYLVQPNASDARGVVAFNLLAIWMLTGWCVGPSALSYAAKLALVFLCFGGLVALWRAWAPHLAKKA